MTDSRMSRRNLEVLLMFFTRLPTPAEQEHLQRNVYQLGPVRHVLTPKFSPPFWYDSWRAVGSYRSAAASPKESTALIEAIEQVTLRRNRDGKSGTWFHPRACMLPGNPPTALMTLQTIGGSDYFGPAHWSESKGFGATWTDPEPILSLGREPERRGLEEGVCDVVPEHHPPTKTVLALGHNVFYRDGRFPGQQPPRCPVYAVRRPGGTWSEKQTLEWDDPRGAVIYTNNCGQRVT